MADQFVPKHDWTKTTSTATVTPPQPAAGPVRPGAATTSEQAVQTPPAIERARIGASADPEFKEGDQVRVKGRGAGAFAIESIDDDGTYHFKNAKGKAFSAQVGDLEKFSHELSDR